MLRKCFLVPMVGVFAVLAVAVDVQAQGLRERRMERRDARRGIVYLPYTAEPASAEPLAGMNQTPTSVTNTAMARISYYPTPANASMGNACQIRVILPDAQAKVWFDNKATTSMGSDRLFLTPELPTGAPCNYTVKCTFMLNGKEVTREEVLTCNPGMICVVDCTRPLLK